MHRQALHLRLINYITRLELGSQVEVEDGYYRFLIQLKVDTKNDMIHIKRTGFDKYLANADDIKQIETEEKATLTEPKAKIDPSKILDYMQVAGWAALIGYILRSVCNG